jgi:hypothetical protein
LGPPQVDRGVHNISVQQRGDEELALDSFEEGDTPGVSCLSLEENENEREKRIHSEAIKLIEPYLGIRGKVGAERIIYFEPSLHSIL